MSGFDTPAVDQRLDLFFSHFTAIFATGLGIAYRQWTFVEALVGSWLASSMMHWCDSSQSYGLIGASYCFSLTPHFLYFLDKLMAAQLIQTALLSGPDWQYTEARIFFLYMTFFANAVVAYTYSETWPLVVAGVTLGLTTQIYRVVVLVLYDMLGFFLANVIHWYALFWTLVFAAVGIAFFWVDEGQYYWILHSEWHMFIYASAGFALWTYIKHLPLLVLFNACRGVYPSGLLWTRNFWGLHPADK
jgi:hypothetical protein